MDTLKKMWQAVKTAFLKIGGSFDAVAGGVGRADNGQSRAGWHDGGESVAEPLYDRIITQLKKYNYEEHFS